MIETETILIDTLCFSLFSSPPSLMLGIEPLLSQMSHARDDFFLKPGDNSQIVTYP
jgi:hypothetical protein